MKQKKSDNLCNLNGYVPVGQAIPFGFQHLLAMFVANITPVMILADTVGLDEGTTAGLVRNAMVIAGLATVVQVLRLWRIGARLPMIMGISFTFLTLSISIAATFGMDVLIGSVVAGGTVEGVLGLFAKYWRKYVSPLTAATVVVSIGFSLLPVGANSFAGGQGTADFGSADNWITGSVALAACVVTQVFGNERLRSLSILSGLVVGYVLAAVMGKIDYSVIHNVPSVVALPELMPFHPEFRLGPILSMTAIFLVSATETIGDTSALAETALGRNLTSDELSGSIACDGFASSLSGLFGCTPITTFSQNVGLITITKVINRFVISTCAIMLMVAGLFPVVGAALTTIPQSVLGGCSILMFGSVLYAGITMLCKCGFNRKNMLIISISLSVGIGFTSVAGMFGIFPPVVRSVFADNGVAIVFLLSLILDNIMPERE